MIEFVPIALACGHITSGFVSFVWNFENGERHSRVDCPEGCGLQAWVAEPQLDADIRN